MGMVYTSNDSDRTTTMWTTDYSGVSFSEASSVVSQLVTADFDAELYYWTLLSEK